jgi:acyl carrier protein
VAADSLDGVLLSSVVQYFPNVEYLLEVLRQSLSAVRAGGFVLLADLRHYGLVDWWEASVEAGRAEPRTTVEEVRRRMQLRRAQERELFVDPTLFVALRHQDARIASVQLRLQRGRARNELNTFRYSVVLHVGEPPAGAACARRPAGLLALSQIEQQLREGGWERVCFSGLANARLAGEQAFWRRLQDAPAMMPVAELREALAAGTAIEPEHVIEPEDVYELGERLGYEVELFCAPGAPERMDAVFVRPGTAPAQVPLAQEKPLQRPWSSYANNPLSGKLSQELLPELKRHLRLKLPHYMVPANLVLLDALPLTATGKLDRRALPDPDAAALGADHYHPPTTALQQALAAIWCELLGLERISTTANFFDVGGHSLLATQLVSRIRRNLDVEIPLRTIFENPVLEDLCTVILKQEESPGHATSAAELMLEIEQMSADDVQLLLKKVG